MEQPVALEDVYINPALPQKERAQEFYRQIGNPCRFRVGKVVVNLEFTPGGKPFEEALRSYLYHLEASQGHSD
ncbi:hypothetical protein U6B65_09300 [Oscillospiraceae bacterium MB08-C2-2]|nr:hypothetical protein U6B65_09300 [Oscillospiraceae bacterium MB08-C2-2]